MDDPELEPDVVEAVVATDPEATSDESAPLDAGPAVDDSTAERTERRGPVFARVLESEQLVSGKTRWSVGSSRRVCCRCGHPFADRVYFNTALCKTEVDDERLSERLLVDAAQVFERLDFCDDCFDVSARDASFAHWRSVTPVPTAAPRKIVNLASLRAYFDQVADAVNRHSTANGAYSSTTADDPSDRFASEIHDVDDDEDAVAESVAGPGLPREASHAALTRLQYLLGLFLVRKRSLKWVGLRGGRAYLECRPTGRRYRLEIPEPGEELDVAAEDFEALFS